MIQMYKCKEEQHANTDGSFVIALYTKLCFSHTTVWKYEDFSVIQILREINWG